MLKAPRLAGDFSKDFIIVDSLLLLGPKDDRLERLLAKLGYDLIVGDDNSPVTKLLSGKLVDLIVFDARLDSDSVDLFEYLRTDESTKQTPIIVLSANPQQREKAEKFGLESIDFVDAPVSPGSLAGKIATQLRLRKMKGAEENTATLAEINAALRDLNHQMQKEMEEARSIQESLLPETLPQDPRFDLAVSYDPLEEVGGDWYFIQKEKSGTLSLLVADVTGHGLAAAFIGSMTKLAQSAARQEEPGKLLTAMNALMTPQLPPGRFVTLNSASYNPATGSLAVSCAGHPPCIVVSPSTKAVKKLGSKGFALGFLPDAEFEVQNDVCLPGDIVVLLTDGISEAQNRSNAMYGMDRIGDVVMRNAARSAKEILAAVLDDLQRFCDGRILKDDVTMVVLKRNA